MSKTDKNQDTSKEGCGRVIAYKRFGIKYRYYTFLLSYTLESTYDFCLNVHTTSEGTGRFAPSISPPYKQYRRKIKKKKTKIKTRTK